MRLSQAQLQLSQDFSMLSVVPHMWAHRNLYSNKSQPPMLPDVVGKCCLALEKCGIDYVIGGGVTLAAHGCVQATRECDMDIFPQSATHLVGSGRFEGATSKRLGQFGTWPTS